MKKYLNIFLNGILAGVFIGIGVTVFLAVAQANKIVASLLFGLGLFCVIQFKAFLYTGKVGYLLDNKLSYLIDLLIGLIGNFLGIIVLCSVMKLTRLGTYLTNTAIDMVVAKQSDKWYSILILSIMCGVMIYLAVEGQKYVDHGFGKVLICFLCVSVFILSGFEHCIANAGYYTYAGSFNSKVVLYFIIMIIGNGIGSILIDGLIKLIKKTNKNQ